jgi:RNA polymerase sigma-70 factor (ECF subfamily)
MRSMPGGGEREVAKRSVVYCVIPSELAGELHEPLRRHFADDPGVDVVVEQRWRGRRGGQDRRGAELPPPAEAGDRRRIRAAEGRRVADRRAAALPVEPPVALPRKARAHADQLVFLERVEPTTEQVEDRDTARVVTRFQAGDEEVFASLYVRYFDRVYSYLHVALRNATEAEDLTQEVFARVFAALPGYVRRSQPFRGWLFVIVRNVAVDHLRKHSRVTLGDEQAINDRREHEGAGSADLHVLDWITDRELLMFIERLPLVQRQVLVLRFMLDLSVTQIAELLDTTSNNVSVLQRRALGFLRERLVAVGRAPRDDYAPRMRRRVPQAQVLRTRRFVLLS